MTVEWGVRPVGTTVFFNHKVHERGTEVTEGNSLRWCAWVLMDEMLKQVQHDGRVGIIEFTESVINGRHPELVSGSLLF
jgi:hypothetical protein